MYFNFSAMVFLSTKGAEATKGAGYTYRPLFPSPKIFLIHNSFLFIFLPTIRDQQMCYFDYE